ncbi:MAG: 50S ribosomal protein P1 [archaeon]
MEYIYAAMLLHKAGKTVDGDGIKKVLSSAGISADEGKIKALVSALENVKIEDAIKKAAAMPTASAAPAAGAGDQQKKDDKKEEADKAAQDEAASAGLAALFG